jgi:hypothetical protein
VTHACFDPRELAGYYPRGGQALIGPFHRFQPRDTIAWFQSRGVDLKTEADGRVFPVTDSSGSIVDCFLRIANEAGVDVRRGTGARDLVRRPGGGFRITLTDGGMLDCDRVLVAGGGCRRADPLVSLLGGLGHTIEPPVPSLFTFHVDAPWLRPLAGISMADVELSIPETNLSERGGVLVTHSGLSGPAILRLSAWGARKLAAWDYRFPLRVNWTPAQGNQALMAEFQSKRQTQGGRRVDNGAVAPIPARLWERLVALAGIPREQRWAGLSREGQERLLRQVLGTELAVTGKSLNKDEFVTCGGVRLAEVDFRTMESRKCPGLYFAGEVLDIDGLTGGFNFQAAWTTGWIAGQGMAKGPNS